MESVEKSENQFSNDVSSNFVSSDTELAKEIEQPLTDEKMRNCKYCNYQAPDWPTFVVHVLKPSHVKKVAEAMRVRAAVDPMLTNITCEVCDVTCCGYIPWNAHLMGTKHRKAKEEQDEVLQKKKNAGGGPVRNTLFGNLHNKKPYDGKNVQASLGYEFTTYPQPLIGLEYVTQTDRTGKIQWYHCSICDVKFDDNLKFPHLVGQKHRLNVLKVKRPAVVEGIDGNGKKRSEVTPKLLQEAKKLEDEEGRQEIKFNFPRQNATFNAGRGAMHIRGRYQGTTRGRRGNRGVSNTRGRGNIGQYSAQGQHSYPTCNDPCGNNSHSSDLSHSFPYNASLNNFDYGTNYGQSHNIAQSPYGSGQSYSANGPSYSGYYAQSYYSQNTPSVGTEVRTSFNSNLAEALNDLTKLIRSEEDASVALSVSNALTKSLIKFRTNGPE